MATDHVFLVFGLKLTVDCECSFLISLTFTNVVLFFSPSVQHEKYTSQLQLSLKALEARAKEKLQFHTSEKSKGAVANVKLQDRTERKAHSLTGNKLSERRR